MRRSSFFKEHAEYFLTAGLFLLIVSFSVALTQPWQKAGEYEKKFALRDARVVAERTFFALAKDPEGVRDLIDASFRQAVVLGGDDVACVGATRVEGSQKVNASDLKASVAVYNNGSEALFVPCKYLGRDNLKDFAIAMPLSMFSGN